MRSPLCTSDCNFQQSYDRFSNFTTEKGSKYHFCSLPFASKHQQDNIRAEPSTTKNMRAAVKGEVTKDEGGDEVPGRWR